MLLCACLRACGTIKNACVSYLVIQPQPFCLFLYIDMLAAKMDGIFFYEELSLDGLFLLGKPYRGM